MKRASFLAAAAAVVLGLGGLSGSAQAQGPNDYSGHMAMHGPGMGPGMMHGRGRGFGRGMGMRGFGHRMRELADDNGDGRLTSEEVAAFWPKEVKTYDENGDGNLSLDEFARMHAAHTRPRTVRRFQFFDVDGDAEGTESELETPFQDMVRMMDRNDDDAIGPGDMRRRMGRGPGPQR